MFRFSISNSKTNVVNEVGGVIDGGHFLSYEVIGLDEDVFASQLAPQLRGERKKMKRSQVGAQRLSVMNRHRSS